MVNNSIINKTPSRTKIRRLVKETYKGTNTDTGKQRQTHEMQITEMVIRKAMVGDIRITRHPDLEEYHMIS